MARTVYFNNKLVGSAIKIDNIFANIVLSSEF